MFCRLNLKVRCERRRRNKSYTSTGLAREKGWRGLLLLHDYSYWWSSESIHCQDVDYPSNRINLLELGQVDLKRRLAMIEWLDRALLTVEVRVESRHGYWLGRSKSSIIIISESKEYGEKRGGGRGGPYSCSNPVFTSISLYRAPTTLLRK